MFGLVKPIIDYRMRALCIKPYYQHPKGCPNYGKRATCPPKAPKLEAIIDITLPIYCIYNRFDLAAHVREMQARHPSWTERQLYCCLYWQPKARKILRNQIWDFIAEKGHNFRIISCPEACGVSITETMKQLDIILEWPPKYVAYQVVLAGIEQAVLGSGK